MIRITVGLAVVFTLIFPMIGWGDSGGSMQIPGFCDSANRFAIALYGRAGLVDQNLVFSPYSIDTALLMTYAGAAGDTAKQMRDVLQLPADGGDPHEAAGQLVARFQSGDNQRQILRIADALWGQKGIDWTPKFLDLLQNNYHAKLANLDFALAEEARKTINDWVAAQTNDKIKDLIPAGLLDKNTRLVLTNAVYFKADWEEPFESEATHDGDFHADGKTETIPTPMMHQTGRAAFLHDDELSALQMSYKQSDLAMLILLPNKIDGLADLESKLDTDRLAKVVAGLGDQTVGISIPKFKFTTRFSVTPALRSMGLDKPFGSEADFSGMDGGHDLFISDVVHQAYVAVDEKGTEAAAATGIMMRATAMPLVPTAFNADHPFLFLIRDTKTGIILFMGRVQNPAEKQ